MKCETEFEEVLAVVGSIEELGLWDVQKALKLRTNEVLYPEWKTEMIVRSGPTIEYKYIKCKTT